MKHAIFTYKISNTDTPIMALNSCPGTNSQNAGKSNACEGCPNVSYCSQPKEKDHDLDLIRENISSVKKFISVMSGKGGVGKSTFTVNLANSLSKSNNVMIVDIDISGPSIPRITNSENTIIFETNNKIYPVKISERLSVISVGYFLTENLTYTSKTKNSTLKRIFRDVYFESGTIVIIDTPPGIADEHLALANWISLDGAIIISTPHRIAFSDVLRQIDFCKKSGIYILGILENMKHFICSTCNHKNMIYDNNRILEYCIKENIKFLGSINLDPNIAMLSDQGEFINSQTIENLSSMIL